MLREQLRRARYSVSSCVGNRNKEVITLIVVPRGASVPCICAVACPETLGFRGFINNSFAPRGAREKQFQSYGLCTASYANIVGWIREGRNMLSVASTWGVSQSHSCSGKMLSVVARELMKCALNVWMVRSAAFTLWLLGLTRRLLHCCVVRYFWLPCLLGYPSHSL